LRVRLTKKEVESIAYDILRVTTKTGVPPLNSRRQTGCLWMGIENIGIYRVNLAGIVVVGG